MFCHWATSHLSVGHWLHRVNAEPFARSTSLLLTHCQMRRKAGDENGRSRENALDRKTVNARRGAEGGTGRSTIVSERQGGRSLQQLADHFAVVEQVLWAAGGVGDGDLAGVDAEVLIERGKNVLISDGPAECGGGIAVGFADHLPGLHSAAGEDGGADGG